MHCDDVRAQLLLPDASLNQEVESHLSSCTGCAAAARSGRGLDDLLRSSLLAEPPAELQARLQSLALAAAPRLRAAWPLTWLQGWLGRLGPAFTLGAVQAIAVILLAAGAWLIWQLVELAIPWLVQLPVAVQLVISSPLGAYLPDLQAQLQPFVGLAAVSVLAWVALDAGIFTRPLRELRH